MVIPLIDEIEQPLRWDIICSDGIGTKRLHSRQVIAYALGRRERLTVRRGGERTVRQSLNPQSLFTAAEQLPLDANATTGDVRHHTSR